MARANRHYIPGHVWHLTHRCHKREFLLKFGKDRLRWMQWLFEAKKRYGLVILNYVVTSNHVHLIVHGKDGGETIPKSIQLLAGRTGQEYNQRKKRKGAFWEDRYHATAIEAGEHLLRCLVYVDLNMVRSGVVSHPEQWPHGGYNEIQRPRRKNILITKPLVIFPVSTISQTSSQCIDGGFNRRYLMIRRKGRIVGQRALQLGASRLSRLSKCKCAALRLAVVFRRR